MVSIVEVLFHLSMTLKPFRVFYLLICAALGDTKTQTGMSQQSEVEQGDSTRTVRIFLCEYVCTCMVCADVLTGAFMYKGQKLTLNVFLCHLPPYFDFFICVCVCVCVSV